MVSTQVVSLIAQRSEIRVLRRLRSASKSIFAETSMREFWLARSPPDCRQMSALENDIRAWERIEMFGEHWRQMEWIWHSKLAMVKSMSSNAAREMLMRARQHREVEASEETITKRRGSDQECKTDTFTLVAKVREEGDWEMTMYWDSKFRSSRRVCDMSRRRAIDLLLLCMRIVGK
jgi:hypothetical protein